jgi:hypothetical protein
MLYRLTSDHVRLLVAEAYAFAEHLDRDIPHHSVDDADPVPRRGSALVAAAVQR